GLHRLSVSMGTAGSARRAGGAADGHRPRLPDGEHDSVPQPQGRRCRLAALVPRGVPRGGGHRTPRLAPADRARRPVVQLHRLVGGDVPPRAVSPASEPAVDAAGASGITGSLIVTAVPFPFSLSTEIAPPLSSMFLNAIGSPSPVPEVFVEKYGSNTRESASASMP